MSNSIYFTKIEYQEILGDTTRVIFLNTVERELSLQVFERVRQIPATKKLLEEEFLGKSYQFEVDVPAKIISNSKTNFQPRTIEDDAFIDKIVFSYGIKLSDNQLKDILKYCNALDFEPYRGKEMSMGDEGYIGYRDEVRIKFKGVTDSYIPLLELPMQYYYDEKHIWPSEKLYRYLIKTYFEKNKKVKNWAPTYGGLSLFI